MDGKNEYRKNNSKSAVTFMCVSKTAKSKH